MKSRHIALKCGLTVLGAAIASQLHAQTQPAGLEEIIVTAQKRAETAQDIPIAIDVIGGDAFIREGVRDVKDIQKMSTELEINTNSGQNTIIGVRGMQQVGFAPTGDSLTAVHLDGAFLSSYWGLNGLMYDLERVEVLSGPQGTLYGRNTAAGAINLITKRPGGELEANGSIEYGSEDATRVNGGVTVPLGQTFSMRLAGQKYTRDALFTDGGSEQDQWGARLSTLWTPDEQNELLITFDRTEFNGTNDTSTLYALDQDVRALVSVSPAGVPTFSATQRPSSITNYAVPDDLYDNRPYWTQQRGQVLTPQHSWQENWGVMGQYTHMFDVFSATLQYAHRELEGVVYPINLAPTQFSGSLTPNVIDSDVAELRLTSTGNGRLQWVGGLFWTQAEVQGWGASPLADAAGVDPVTGLDIPSCPCNSGFFPNNGEMYSYAAYGQTTWTPASHPQLHLTAGLRYTFDWKSAALGYYAGNVPVFGFGYNDMPASVRALFVNAGLADAANGDNDRTWDSFQYKGGIQYDVTDSSMLYGSISTGYKSGGLVAGPTPEVKPENILAYEVGTKSRFRDNTLQLNTAVWYYDYTDLEATVNRPLGYSILLPNGSLQSTAPSRASVGKIRLAGTSGELDWLFTGSDRLGLSFTYTYSRVIDGAEITPSGKLNEIFHEGQRLGDAPKWQMLGRYSHIFGLANGGRLNPQIKYQWQSGKYDGAIIPGNSVPVGGNVDLATGRVNLARQLPGQTAIPAQGTLDLSLKYVPAAGRWELTAYVNNATDELIVRTLEYDNNPGTYNPATGLFSPSATYGQTLATLGEPRTWGIILSTQF